VLTLGLTEVLRKKIVKQVLKRKNASNKNEKNTIAIKKEIVQANVAPTLPSHCANFATNKPIETVQFKTVVTVLFFHWYISVNCPVIAWQLTETVYSSLFSDIMTELTQRKNHQWPLLWPKIAVACTNVFGQWTIIHDLRNFSHQVHFLTCSSTSMAMSMKTSCSSRMLLSSFMMLLWRASMSVRACVIWFPPTLTTCWPTWASSSLSWARSGLIPAIRVA